MTFLLFKGPVKKGESLTAGRIYLGKPGMESSDVVALDLFRVADDTGKTLAVSNTDERWAFLSSVYAVVVKQFNGYRPGEVVILRDVTDDGLYAVVSDSTDCQSLDTFVILDSEIASPGIMVMERKTGLWKSIAIVNESQWIGIDLLKELQPPTDYVFAVSGGLDGSRGDILSRPMVRCLVASDGVTAGSWYCVERSNGQFYTLRGDDGKPREYLAERFKM